jgi:chromate reductase
MAVSIRPRVLALAGSMREQSFNRKLLRIAVALAEGLGAEIDLAELRALNLPLYDGDLEAQGIPAEVTAFQARIQQAHGLLLACPEYNHGMPGAFKNAIDWASRPPGNPFPDKAAALIGATTSGFGATRALMQLRLSLSSRGVWVVPAVANVSNAQDAFDAQGQLKDAGTQKQVATAVGHLLLQIRRQMAVPG